MESSKSNKFITFCIILSLVGIAKFIRDQSALTLEQQKFISESNYTKPITWLKALCKEKSECEKLQEVRQQCATAGNIDECTKIKMNNEVPSFCANNGHIIVNRLLAGEIDLTNMNLVPSPLQCFALKFTKDD